MAMLTEQPTNYATIAPRWALGAPRSATGLLSTASSGIQSLSRHQRSTHMPSSYTWTTNSRELGFISDTDQLDDRTWFVQEYNRLASKHGVRLLVDTDFGRHPQSKENVHPSNGKRSWLSRFLRSASTGAASGAPLVPVTNNQAIRRRRSVSDFAQSLVGVSNPSPQELDLQTMVRISGKSVLYLPQEYTPASLVLPTCIRATAQHLAQYPDTRGMFRIPGSAKAVDSLFEYYCRTEKSTADVAGTVRYPDLPSHLATSVHDVASTFKRFLAALPGGLLGSLSLFDTLVAIRSQLDGDPKSSRKKQTKVRAQMIALAIGSVESQFRRRLICGVLGLLSFVGRVAEVARREEEDDVEPLPPSDLMGYNALGIIFGPLLIGDLLAQYKTNVATPASGLLLLPVSSTKLQKAQKARQKPFAGADMEATRTPVVDKIHVANHIAEMLIANWRDIVRQMKSMGMEQCKPSSTYAPATQQRSVSRSLAFKRPREWNSGERDNYTQAHQGISPRTGVFEYLAEPQSKSQGSTGLRRRSHGPGLSPMLEELPMKDGRVNEKGSSSGPGQHTAGANLARSLPASPTPHACNEPQSPFENDIKFNKRPEAERWRVGQIGHGSPEVSMEDVPPRTSSKQRLLEATPTKDPLSSSKESQGQAHTLKAVYGLQHRPERPSIADSPFWNQEQDEDCSHERMRTGVLSRKSPASHEAVRSDPGARGRASTRIADGAMGASPQNLTLDPKPASAKLSSDTPANAATSLDLPLWNSRDNSHYQCSNGDPDYRPKPQTPEPILRSSICATPRRLYAPVVTPFHSTGKKEICTPVREEIVFDSNDLELGHPDTTPEQETKPTDSKGQLFQSTNSTCSDLILKHVSPTRIDALDLGSRNSGVRAMAAKFEGACNDSQASNSLDKPDSRSENPGGSSMYRPAIKLVRSKLSTTMDETNGSPSRHTSSSKSPSNIMSRSPRIYLSQQPGNMTSEGRLFNSDNGPSRAVAIMEAEKRHQRPSDEQYSFSGQKQSPYHVRNSQHFSRLPVASRQRRGMASLGTWVPHKEQSPVAQHLNLAKPTSFAPEKKENNIADASSWMATPRRGSNTSMHTQIHSLQRQLDLKTEENLSLRRQLEAHEKSDVGTLSEQLREAKRDSRMWKGRAQTAERRVQVLEKFTNRLEGIREASGEDGRVAAQIEEQQCHNADGNVSPNRLVKLVEGCRADEHGDKQ